MEYTKEGTTGMIRTNLAVVEYEGVRLLVNEHGIKLADSLILAEDFGRDPKNVLRDVRKIIDTAQQSGDDDLIEFTRLNFEPSEYTDSTGRTLPRYLLSELGYQITAMGFTGAKALKWKIKYALAFKFAASMALQNSNDFVARRVAQEVGDFFQDALDHKAAEIVDKINNKTVEAVNDVAYALQTQQAKNHAEAMERITDEQDSGCAFIQSEIAAAVAPINAAINGFDPKIKVVEPRKFKSNKYDDFDRGAVRERNSSLFS